MSLFTAFRKEWMEALRSYRLLIVVVVLVFFGLISPFLARYMPELMKLIPTGDIVISAPPPTVANAISQYVKNIAQAGLFLALLLTMGAVAQEKDKGTAAMMLVKPLSRSAFLGAKFLSLGAIFVVSLALAGIASYYYITLLFEAMNILHWLVLNAFIFLYILVIVSMTLFCSTVTKSQAAALGVIVGLLVVGWMASGILRLGKYLPGELYVWGVRLLQGDFTPSWIAFGVSLGLIVISLLAAWLIFRKQEL
jgi:ABC-2 type transport system permease protein